MNQQKDRFDFLCCEKCFDITARHSPAVAIIWMDLCSQHVQTNQPISFSLEESETMEFLEKNGFISTHDTHESILVRVNGFIKGDWEEEEEDYFCIKPDAHCFEEEDETEIY